MVARPRTGPGGCWARWHLRLTPNPTPEFLGEWCRPQMIGWGVQGSQHPLPQGWRATICFDHRGSWGCNSVTVSRQRRLNVGSPFFCWAPHWENSTGRTRAEAAALCSERFPPGLLSRQRGPEHLLTLQVS